MSAASGDETAPDAERGAPSGWAEQAAATAEAWTEAQQQMWRTWSDLAVRATRAPGAGTPWSHGGPAGDVSAQWQRMARQAMGAWTAGTPPAAKGLAERMFTSQQAVTRFMQALIEAWQTAATEVADGTSWREALEGYREGLEDSWPTVPGLSGQTAEELTELWGLYVTALERLTGPWRESLVRAPDHLGSAMAGDRSELAELARLSWDAWERTGGRLLEAPSLGYTRELEEQLLRGFDAWLDYRRAVSDYQLVLGEGWGEAFEAVLERLVARAQNGQPVESLEELTELWTQTTDSVLEDLFRTERYAAAQGEMLNAAMQYRIHEQAIVETFLRSTPIATRSELDEAFEEVVALRREVRALRGELETLRGEGGAT